VKDCVEVFVQMEQIESPVLNASAAVDEHSDERVEGGYRESALCGCGDGGIDLCPIGEDFVVGDA
jgi:hypothetical protein